MCSAPPSAIANGCCAAPCVAIAEEGAGVLVYLHQTGPGFRIERAGRAMVARRIAPHGRELHALQHEHGIGAQILSDLGLHTIRLLTNHPRKVVALEGFGIEIVDQIAVPPDAANAGR